MSIYTGLIRPALFRTDPEAIHHLSLALLARTPLARLLALGRPVPSRPVRLWNLTFRNPLGLAAGFDKEAAALHAWEKLGFGFVEAGTITRHAQPGNPRPRIFRCPAEQGLINRMGFPNSGADAIAARLEQIPPGSLPPDFPIGINLGKSKITDLDQAAADYLYSFKRLFDLGHFFVVNVSSPNTPGLRTLQDPTQLRPILRSLQQHNAGRKPLLVKIAPDLDEPSVEAILQLIADESLAGIVATNTTLDHSAVALRETGGLSGLPVRQKSTAMIRFISRQTGGKLPIIGVGGVFTRDDFQEKLDAGASLVQVYTGFIYRGPWIAHEILAP
jgi:dihydroorotate dehydrogenase